MPAGRPTILTPELSKQFCDLIRAGNYFETACGYLGIDKTAAYDWLNKGAAGQDATGEWPDVYREFANAFTQAETFAEASSVALLKQAGQPHQIPGNLCEPDGKPKPGVVMGDWRATAEFLSRRYRERWAPNAKHEVTGKGGKPIQHEHTGGVDVRVAVADPAMRATLATLAEQWDDKQKTRNGLGNGHTHAEVEGDSE